MSRLIRATPVLLVALSLAFLLWPRRGQTVPLYAARTGLMCQACHFDPNGGGPRNDFGFMYERNRHEVAAEDSTSPWGDLSITNRVAENVPIYLGVNQRFMLLANRTESDSLDRLGFYSMENAFHLTFQPHPRLTLVYTRDGFDGGAKSQDAWGMIGGFPWNGYFKAGRIRSPFGLRLDDHTVATRNSFVDFVSGNPFSPPRFLPYDPRSPDMGYEIGLGQGGFSGQAAFTNGSSHPLFSTNPFAQTKAVKLGYLVRGVQGAVSFYDEFRQEPDLFDPLNRRRMTRWGTYALAHAGPLAALGEIAAGTDRARTGERTNLLAGFAEIDYTPLRTLNFRLRYDRLELDRSADPLVRDLNTFDRFSVEGEYVPVPFAEVRWTVRQIEPKAGGLPNETQAYVQLHFSY